PSLGTEMRTGISYGSLFLLVLLATALVGLAVRKAVDTLHLGFFDRLGGAALGLATGAVLHFALLVCVILFAKADRLALLEKDSRSLRAAVRVAQLVSPALPPEARARIDAARARIPQAPLVPEPEEGAPASAPAPSDR
ncbi:MAG: CvpA family protein, partial [Planctomycetes bacterium]|nr:CvpA family protein [Planctomycetota bacterium]